MKKVLILSSSPRSNGNSEYLCKMFAAGAKEAGHEVEMVKLRDKKINYCTGCGYCFKNKGKCTQKDDMQELGDKLIQSDVIVFATPVYFYAMTAQMKTFIDRTCAFYTLVKDKEVYYIITAAENGVDVMQTTITELRGYTECFENTTEVDVLLVDNVWEKGEAETSTHGITAFQMGKNL